jgi:hypothetical protein
MVGAALKDKFFVSWLGLRLSVPLSKIGTMMPPSLSSIREDRN